MTGPNQTQQVDDFLANLDHAFKAEVETIRKIIKGVDAEITEQIKWNAPSFSYKGEYLVTFNLRATERIHLVFHNPRLPSVDSDLLEGDYRDRRMAYFAGMADVRAKQAELQGAVRQLVRLIDQES